MSNIVFLGAPAHGHTNPTLPVVQELAQRGEHVRYYNHEEFRLAIERTGAVFCPYPVNKMSSAEIARSIQEGNLINIGGLILAATADLLPYLLDELARHTPDLVVFDSMAVWGKMAATILGLCQVSAISHFVFDTNHLMGEGEHSLRNLWQMLPKLSGMMAARVRLSRRYPAAFPKERPLLPLRGGLNLVFTARALQPDTPLIDESFRFVGPSINRQTRDEDLSLETLGQGRVVYISLGTVHHANTEFYRQCFEAFAEYPAQFILAAGRGADLHALGPVPSNFIVGATVPQLEVLQRADAFITHGGMNSIHEGLYFGVPLIVIPHQIEQLLNGRCVEKHGAALVLDSQLAGKGVTAAALQQALDQVLAAAPYLEAATRVQQVLRETGGYRQAADEIQAHLAHTG